MYLFCGFRISETRAISKIHTRSVKNHFWMEGFGYKIRGNRHFFTFFWFSCKSYILLSFLNYEVYLCHHLCTVYAILMKDQFVASVKSLLLIFDKTNKIKFLRQKCCTYVNWKFSIKKPTVLEEVIPTVLSFL